MLIVLIIIGLICLVLLIFLFICLSTLRIEVSKLKIDSSIETGKILDDYIIFFKLYLFNKIRWFSIKINRYKIKKIQKSKFIEWINKKITIKIKSFKDITKLLLENRKDIFNKETLRYIKELDLKISEIKLDLTVGIEDVVITSYLTALISSVISIILGVTAKDFDEERYRYKITPAYISQNFLKMDLNCIIILKMVHIINIIYLLLKKRSDKEYDRTSNRRTYGYSYGQHPRHG